MSAATTNAVSTELRFNDEMLSSIKTMDDVTALFRDSGIVPETIEDYGNGFKVCKDKTSLVGVPFVILEWRFVVGDYSRDGEKGTFVSAYVVTERGDKHVLVDGGTGIHNQLRNVTNLRTERGHAHPSHGLMVPQGLVRSTYEFPDAKGEMQPGVTFYLSE